MGRRVLAHPKDDVHERPLRGVRREKAALSSGCKTHPATAPAGSKVLVLHAVFSVPTPTVRLSAWLFNIVVRADDCVVGDPEVSLTQLLIEWPHLASGRGCQLNRAPIQLGNVELPWRYGRLGVRWRLGNAAEDIEGRHHAISTRTGYFMKPQCIAPLAIIAPATTPRKTSSVSESGWF